MWESHQCFSWMVTENIIMDFYFVLFCFGFSSVDIFLIHNIQLKPKDKHIARK